MVKYTDQDKDGNKETLVIGGNGAMKDLTTLTYSPDDQPWSSGVTTLTIQEGITVIGKYAFRDTNINTVTIPASVKEIRAFAFYNCALTEVKFANDSQLEKVGESVFAENNIKSIVFPNKMKSIYGQNVLYNNPELTLIQFTSVLNQLDLNAFNGVGIDVNTIIDTATYDLLLEEAKKLYFPITIGGITTYGKKTTTLVELYLPNNWNYINRDEKGQLCNGYFSKHIHTRYVTKVNELVPTATTSGYRDYYHCELCGKNYENEECTVFIADVDAWKAKGGNGYIPCTDPNHKHEGSYIFGISATIEHDGYKPYYECECGKHFEDEECKIEIAYIEAWKKQGGNGYLPIVEHTHQAITHYGKSATIYYDGYNTFYLCSCGKYFEDEKCTKEITNLNEWMKEGGAGFIPRIVEKEDYTQLFIAIIACVIVAGLIVTYIIINKKEKQKEVKEVEKATKTTKKTTKKTKKTE